MKDFQKLIEECLVEVQTAGIKPGPITEWKINTRAKRRWGLCTKKPSGEYVIQIAERLLTDERISELACKNTIIHEILHTCVGCMGHTGKWKKYADIMNLRGYNIKRVTTGEEKGVENYKANRRPVKYIFVCRNCGVLLHYKRACKFTKYYRNYTCGRCGTPRAFRLLGKVK